MSHGKRTRSIRFPDLPREKNAFNFNFLMCHAKTTRSFPNLMRSFAVADREFGFPDEPREKNAFNSISRSATRKERVQFQFPDVPRQNNAFFSKFDTFF